ncbi:myeloperoxidase-like isoform X2 [Mytilus californianus]|uniref:myeloperoxidase-like isoform X2 n=1 Tax=Mytilus californianus TaxID=6549 RepID=UPI0022462F5F|nr:myeloperoxidase-like isoform X2 [Mytilus californianus]
MYYIILVATVLLQIIIDSASSVFHHKVIPCPKNPRYRSFDGSCNNLRNPTWGQAGTAQRRLRDINGRPMVSYEDGKSLPRGFPNRLPDPRLVSNVVSDPALGPYNQFDKIRTGQHMAFGQLLAHDFIETDIPSGFDCCNRSDPNFGNADVCFPLDVPCDDERFPAGCKNFIRAKPATEGTYLPSYWEQKNLVSSYIDASFLYGIQRNLTLELRVPNSFLMKTDPGNLLPTRKGGNCLKLSKMDKCPFTGDRRNHEVPNLGLNHLLFVREHNRLSTKLHELNPCWSSEKVFQETRRIIIAQVQHITYNHFLPLVVDHDTMRRFNLLSKTNGFDHVYDDSVDASCLNSFGIAAWRYGHSQIMAEQSELKNDYRTVLEHRVEDYLLSPNLWQHSYGKRVTSLSRWLATEPALKIDNFLVEGLRDKLFYITTPPGSDLFSLNIQRGRDQGVPAYNEWRKFCGLRKFRSFDEFGKFGSNLALVYKKVDEVDLYIGGLLEEGENGSVGPTFSCIIGIQFHRFKVGDRYWYESSDPDFAFTIDQLNSIKSASLLSKIYCTNFGLNEIQDDIFMIPSLKNPVSYCRDLPDLDLYLWKDKTCAWATYLSGSGNGPIDC